MSQIAQQMIAPVFADPDNVRETFVNGPINVSFMGPIATLTFTTVRQDVAQAMKGEAMTKATAFVTARVSMPTELAVELKGLLNRTLQESPMMPGSNRTQ